MRKRILTVIEQKSDKEVYPVKKYYCLMLSLLLILASYCQVIAEEVSCTITLHYGLEGYADETISVQLGTKMNKALTNKDFQQVSRTPYGYDFDTWYYDAELTRVYNKQDIVESDLDLYAGWTPWDSDRKEMLDAWVREMDLCKELLNYMPMYTPESFWPYHQALFMGWNGIRKASWERIEELQALRASLVQVHEKEEVIWEIWGDQIPQEDASGYSFWLLQDSAEFRPVLAAFLLDDQTQVKGNIIICPGGGFEHRSNDAEGYPTAEHMNALGYNCFVLQYRLQPYVQMDAFLDLQRAIRYVRYNAKEKGIAYPDRIATIGYSAGSFVVLGQIAYCYGDVQPNAFYPDYVPDEVDALNSDVLAAGPIYGPHTERLQAVLDTKNSAIPPMFIAVGTKDSMCDGVVQGFLTLKDITECELHVYNGAPHAFGMADKYTGADQIDEEFDAFLEVYFGLKPRIAP